MHALDDLTEKTDRHTDRELWVWHCQCGARGRGSVTRLAAQQAFAKHAGIRVSKPAQQPAKRTVNLLNW